jgi:hypothetical protein
MPDFFAPLRPVIAVTASRNELVFESRSVFKAAPVIWFNEAGQVAAVGEDTDRRFAHLRRVDLVDADGVLAETGDARDAAVKFLRYAFVYATLSHPLRGFLRPHVTYAEDYCSFPSRGTSPTRREAAFAALARDVGVWKVTGSSG